MAKLIGLSGYARSGKNTVADVLTNEIEFVQISFADPMRDALYALNPIVGRHSALPTRLQDVINHFGWGNYKSTVWGPEIRELMQRLGTDVARKQWGEDFWVKAAMNKATQYPNVVFTDVRFKNEADAIRELGGEVWRVRRPGIFPANNHVSETDMDDYEFDRYVDNNGTLEDLEAVVLHGLI